VNNYTAIVNLTHDVEDIQLGERAGKKLRVADNTFGKNSETRFFDVLVTSGPDMEVAGRLAKGDQIVVTGTLVAGSYKAKKNSKYAKKGQTIKTDSMPFGRILQVTKSPSFFNQDGSFNTEELEDGAEPEGSTDEPELNDSPADDGSDPLEGVV
jgi:single-stranded DNA-binding protein